MYLRKFFILRLTDMVISLAMVVLPVVFGIETTKSLCRVKKFYCHIFENIVTTFDQIKIRKFLYMKYVLRACVVSMYALFINYKCFLIVELLFFYIQYICFIFYVLILIRCMIDLLVTYYLSFEKIYYLE